MTYTPDKWQQFQIFESMHAPLFERYHLGYKGRTGLYRMVGNSQGKYGREDSDTGAEYKALGHEEVRKGKRGVYCSTDYQCGSFYPATTFITGRSEDGEPLTFEELEKFRDAFYAARTGRVILPRGWDGKKGGWTWENALMYYPDMKPYETARILKSRFPDADRVESPPYGNVVTIYFEPKK